MVLAVGQILFEFIPGTVFAHVLVVLCLKCVVWSLCVIVRMVRLWERWHIRHDSNMCGLRAKRACAWFKTVCACFGRTYVRRACFAR